MHVLIAGDSHTGALERGRAVLDAQGALPPGIDWRIVPLGTGGRMNQPFWVRRQGPAGDHAEILDETYRTHLAKLPPDDPVPDVIGLSMPLWTGRVIRGLIRSEVLPYGIDGPGRPISRALLRKLVHDDQQHILSLARFLREQGLPVFAIEPPGIFHDNRFLLQAGAQTILALWRETRALMQAAVTEIGLEVLDLPASMFDDDGFMRSTYRHEDPSDRHHANAAFGAEMIGLAADLARRMAARPDARATAGAER